MIVTQRSQGTLHQGGTFVLSDICETQDTFHTSHTPSLQFRLLNQERVRQVSSQKASVAMVTPGDNESETVHSVMHCVTVHCARLPRDNEVLFLNQLLLLPQCLTK